MFDLCTQGQKRLDADTIPFIPGSYIVTACAGANLDALEEACQRKDEDHERPAWKAQVKVPL